MTARPTLCVVVPAYNEEAVLPEFYRRFTAATADLDAEIRLLFVNDGSTDRTGDLVRGLQTGDERVGLVELSRNFGKEIALTAGLDHADGDAVIVMDADLQDPPELIPRLVQQWRAGYDVVYAQRTARRGDSLFKRLSAHVFYRLMTRVGDIAIPPDTGDFRLLSRRAANALRQLREHHRFMKGLFAWVGFRQIAIPYERTPRAAGESKWNFWKLWTLALEGFTSFTIAPLKLATYLGLVVALFAFVYGCWIILNTLLFGNPVPGYPSLMVVVLFLGGVQLIAMGVMGEYLGRMFDESKRRPLYFVAEHRPPAGAPRAGERP